MIQLFLSLCLTASILFPIGDQPHPGDPFIIVNKASNELAFINENEIRFIEKNINECFHDDKFLIKMAHGSERGDLVVVESKLRAIEGTILHILKTKDKYKS